MLKAVAQAVGTVLGSIQTSWFFRDRTWTKKQHLEYDHSESVNVYEKSTSPAFIVQEWFFAVLAFAFAGLLWHEMLTNWGENTLTTILAVFFGIPVAAAVTGATLALTLFGVSRWVRAHFTETRCTYCDGSMTYPHKFTEGGLGNKETFKFCSKDCREDWEREYVEYPFSGYYDIQDEETERRVEYENYSSAYEVTDD